MQHKNKCGKPLPRVSCILRLKSRTYLRCGRLGNGYFMFKKNSVLRAKLMGSKGLLLTILLLSRANCFRNQIYIYKYCPVTTNVVVSPFPLLMSPPPVTSLFRYASYPPLLHTPGPSHPSLRRPTDRPTNNPTTNRPPPLPPSLLSLAVSQGKRELGMGKFPSSFSQTALCSMPALPPLHCAPLSLYLPKASSFSSFFSAAYEEM